MRKTGASAGVALALAAAALASAGISTETRTQVREATSVQGKAIGTKAIGTKAIGSTAAVMRAIYGGGRGDRPSYPNGPGWTQAQVQRRACKARNVKRNRLSHR